LNFFSFFYVLEKNRQNYQKIPENTDYCPAGIFYRSGDRIYSSPE
jgi:hypothetical protein